MVNKVNCPWCGKPKENDNHFCVIGKITFNSIAHLDNTQRMRVANGK